MKIHELREQKANKVGEMRGLVETAEKERRSLSDGESGRFDALKGEVSGLEIRIGQAETLATFERHADADPIGGGRREFGDLERRYSIGRAIADLTNTGKLTGAEAEWTTEHRSKSDRAKGQGMHFAAPVSAFMGENRAVLTTAPSGGPGGNLVPTNLGPLIDIPRPQLMVANMGATILSGLTGNLDLPRVKSSGTVTWVGEHQNVSKSDPTFDKVSMTPKTAGGTYEMSRRMMIQAPEIEQILRNDLGSILAYSLDQAAIAGTGAANAPKGIRAIAGVRKVAPTGAWASPKKPTVAELDWLLSTMQGLAEASNIVGNAGWLTHPKVHSTYSRYRDGNGNVLYDSLFGGEPVRYSTAVPSNLGPDTDLCHVYYSGNWSDMVLGYWSSIDMLLNPYHPDVAMNGGALLHAFVDYDVALRHPEGFTYFDAMPTSGAGQTITVNA